MDHKNKSLKQFLLFIIILAGLFLFFYKLGLMMEGKEQTGVNKNKYNNYDFQYDENQKLWFTTVQIKEQPYIIPFYYHPTDLEDIMVEENIENVLYKDRPKEILIGVPNNESSKVVIAAVEISSVTGDGPTGIIKVPTTGAINDQIIEGQKFANCKTATDKTFVINFQKSEQNQIRSEGKCIILEYNGINNSVRVADALVYHLLKIM